jgi:hypothetical protein
MALPANMRIIEQCGRARAPAVLELRLGDAVLFADSIRPAGLHREGRAYLYRSWALPSGEYRLQLALRDSPREDGYDKQQQFLLRIEPGTAALLQVGDGDAELLVPRASSSSSPPPASGPRA